MSEKHIRFSYISNTKNFSRKLSKIFIDEYHDLFLDSLADRLCVSIEEEKQSSELPVSDNTEEQQSVKNPTEQLEQVAKLVNMLKEFKGNAST